MKHPSTSSFALPILAAIFFITPAIAVVNMSWTSTGYASNATDTTSYGSVNNAYNIGTYKVSNAPYNDSHNAKDTANDTGIYLATMGKHSYITQSLSNCGKYNYSVGSTFANMPTVGVRWFSAANFHNWLGNDPGNISTETEAYTLTGAMSSIVSANVYIPSDNEWYKALYSYGTNSANSLYPNEQDTITAADANHNGIEVVDVVFGKTGSSATLGLSGNVWERNNTAPINWTRWMRRGGWLNIVLGSIILTGLLCSLLARPSRPSQRRDFPRGQRH